MPETSFPLFLQIPFAKFKAILQGIEILMEQYKLYNSF